MLNAKVESRFWCKVDKTSSPNGCWLWIAGIFGGYGVFQYNGSVVRAHRISWELKNGQIPEGLFVLHNCPGGDNPACVNPDHLWLGDHTDNMRDRNDKGRQPKGEVNGQSKMTEDNVVELRDLYSTGLVTQQTLAGYFGISQTQVSVIVRGLQWSYMR